MRARAQGGKGIHALQSNGWKGVCAGGGAHSQRRRHGTLMKSAQLAEQDGTAHFCSAARGGGEAGRLSVRQPSGRRARPAVRAPLSTAVRVQAALRPCRAFAQQLGARAGAGGGGDGLAGHTRRPAAPRRGTAAQPVSWPPGRTTLSATEHEAHITAGSRMGDRSWQLRSVWGSHVATAPRARSFGVATLRSIAVASSCRLLNPLLSPRIRAYCPSRRRHGTPGMAMVRSAFPGPLGPQSLVPCGALSLMCAVPCARGPQRVGGQGGSPAACRAAARCAGAFVMAGGGG